MLLVDVHLQQLNKAPAVLFTRLGGSNKNVLSRSIMQRQAKASGPQEFAKPLSLAAVLERAGV